MRQSQAAAQAAIDQNGEDDSTILYFSVPSGAGAFVRAKK